MKTLIYRLLIFLFFTAGFLFFFAPHSPTRAASFEVTDPRSCLVKTVDDPDTPENEITLSEHCKYEVAEGASTISFKITGLSPSRCYVVQGGTGWANEDENFVSQKDGSLGKFDDDEFQNQENEYLCRIANTNNYANNHKVNFIKATSAGVLDIKNICDNMEGIRYDCEDRFSGNYTFSLFEAILDTNKNVTDLRPISVSPNSFSTRRAEAPGSGFNPSNPIDTAFGSFSTDPAEIAQQFLGIAVGIAGGVAFLLMVFGSYRLIFAGGNPESIQHGREIITAAIVGLLVVIFSVFILRLIGISILGLPL